MNEQPIQERYPDLVNTQSDSTLQQLVHDLDASYTSIEPPPQLTWNALRMQHMQKAAAKPRGIATLFRPVHKLSLRTGTILLVTLALLVAAGTTYAALAPELTQTLHDEPGTLQLLNDHQYENLHITKTLDGFTFIIEKAYADTNQVIVGMTIKKPQARPFDDAHFLYSTLRTQQGQNLPFLSEHGRLEKGTESNVFSFDTWQVQDNPATLHLTMTEDTLSVLHSDSVLPQGTPGTTPQVDMIKSTLTFSFSLPFHHGRIFNTLQSVTMGGRTMTLEKAIVTSSETQIYIKGSNIQHDLDIFVATLSVEGHEYAVWRAGFGQHNDLYLTLPYPLLDKHGTWTLTFQYQPHVSLKGGPWVFHFIVP